MKTSDEVEIYKAQCVKLWQEVLHLRLKLARLGCYYELEKLLDR